MKTRSLRRTPPNCNLEVHITCYEGLNSTHAGIEFADGETLTPMDVKNVFQITRSAPGAPPAPDNK